MVNDTTYWKALKKELAEHSFTIGVTTHKDFTIWSREEIQKLQDELLEHQKTTFSEKWFYTHLKKDHDKLPRVDMLNILASYLGYESWTNFKLKVGELPVNGVEPRRKRPQSMLLAGILLCLVAITFALVPISKRHEFCFVDYWQRAPLSGEFRVDILGEDNGSLIADSNACVQLSSSNDSIRLVVRAKYYKQDTILKVVGTPSFKEVAVKTNDYALMIHYFSKGMVEDWRKRRSQLKEMFHENAKIYRQFEGLEGVELYSSKEFIAKMTLPIPQLKNIEVLETVYQGDKIAELRFIQNQKE